MISKERLEDLKNYFWNESNDEDTEIWREDLTDEEEDLVSEWDEKTSESFQTLVKEISKKCNL